VTETSVILHDNADLLAVAVAVRLATRLLDAQAERGEATVVLTGGRIAEKLYAALRDSPVRDVVDWSRVNIWWGDERFLPSGDPDRNETQARGALLDALPLAAERVHPMPAADGRDGDDPEAGAARYAADLSGRYAADPSGDAHFDVVLLGIGEDGHVASLFPEHPMPVDGQPVAAVRDSPKPPPIRTTLTLDTLSRADEVWIIGSGSGKADAINLALAGTGSAPVPAAGVHGTKRTLWLLDREAAAGLPPALRGRR
jgi:6-phosphogluconolactonase